ncbi:MAG: hypothetical protein GWP03_03435 [Proteobacteria bacterium]|nr:hypothetical protein [Pseudomonadota bacterium]
MSFEESAKSLPACGVTHASKIPIVKVEFKRDSEVIIKIPLDDLFDIEANK